MYLPLLNIVLVLISPKSVLSSGIHLDLFRINVELGIEFANLLFTKSVIRILTVNLFKIRFSKTTKRDLSWACRDNIESLHVYFCLNLDSFGVAVKEFLIDLKIFNNFVFDGVLGFPESLDGLKCLVQELLVLLGVLRPSGNL